MARNDGAEKEAEMLSFLRSTKRITLCMNRISMLGRNMVKSIDGTTKVRYFRSSWRVASSESIAQKGAFYPRKVQTPLVRVKMGLKRAIVVTSLK